MLLSALLYLILIYLVVFKSSITLYRLLWHPLAKFPGPSTAAATSLYGAFYDLVLGDRLCRQVAELHKVYGNDICIT